MIYRHQLCDLTNRLVGLALIAAFLFDCVALSFPLNRLVFTGGATPLLQNSSNNIRYMEPGTDATGDLKFFSSTPGVVTLRQAAAKVITQTY